MSHVFRLPCRSGFGGILLLWGLLCLPALGQQGGVDVRGLIVDAETGQPLPGANVVFEPVRDGEGRGAAANSDGFYRVPGLAPGIYSLRASFVGYHTLRDTIRLLADQERVTHTLELTQTQQRLEELLVVGRAGGATTQEAGNQQVMAEDIEHIPTPSISGDLAGYLQAMPGVVSVGDRGGRIYIRGGTPDQNLVMMDKMQVFRPFHIVGFYSAFPQELISTADIYAGGFPARYSGRLSSVIDVEMRGGNRKHVEAGATAGPFVTGIRLEGPLNDSGLSLLGAARFSQIERTAPLILGQDQPLKFNDQFVKLQNTFERGRCGLTGLHTYDRGVIDPERDQVFRWSNFAFGGRCFTIGESTSSQLDLSLNVSYVKNDVGQAQDPEREGEYWKVATKINVSQPLEQGKHVRGGFKLFLNSTRYDFGEKFQGIQAGSNYWLGLNGYLEGTIPVGSRIEVQPGIAANYTFDYGATLEPRVRATWQPFGTDDRELHLAAGRYRQTVVGLSDERDLGSVFTAWVPALVHQDRPAAWHGILGWQHQFGTFGFTAEGYYKRLRNLSVPTWSTIARFTTTMTSADGRSWGFDLRGEFEKGPVYAYVGYGLSWTRYTMRQDNFMEWYGKETQTYNPPHDRRHKLNVVLSLDLGFATTDVRWQLASGLPYTKPFGLDAYIDEGGMKESPDIYGLPRILFERAYGGRLPAYHRLDMSLERTFDFGRVDLTAKGGAINLYDRQNLFYFDLFRQRRVNQLPLVPYLALEMAIE